MNKLDYLQTLKRMGAFQLTKPFAKNKLLILCYHAFELRDECQFRPSLFQKQATFHKRLKMLLSTGYRVLPLDEAISQLKANRLSGLNAVITIDDGFQSVYQLAYPVLKTFKLPVTVYITSYFQTKQTPVFQLAIQYMFWRSKRLTLDLSVIKSLVNDSAINFSNNRYELMQQLIKLGNEAKHNEFREALAEAIGHMLGEDYQSIRDEKLFTLMTDDQLSDSLEDLVDIQLHTHRHQLPLSEEETIKEINENRQVLTRITSGHLNHFCYPSGEWDLQHWSWLQQAGITSATTCQSGFVNSRSQLLALDRILDGENLTEIQFEAELHGVGELARKIKKLASYTQNIKYFRNSRQPIAHEAISNR
ncbi:polysaccharide deacetylase family protein [Endozoicomonas sp. SM1973]|uniref:Polysaccharide deacetylase family protein n=1 Tax=Spartinivicinus marinus TaxID=2994442 RepID=A0A853I2R2_9GAMM|nr:polysaccharide deacetylase family protein [Spartinivicinus marinus]MCX4024981.1 polysaccharide deacetylase family protein [Spartinivicinus marinus]NYZ67673.1 polysaccharide deacetylase family protein [Spartinivicinus marinus]